MVTEDEMKLFTSVNSAVLLLSKYVQMVLDRLTANANVPKDKRSIINMKNELTLKAPLYSDVYSKSL